MAYLKLEYWNSCDIGGLLYQTGYKNIMYLDVDAGKPVFETIEEGQEDGDKNFVSFYTKMVKKYKIETILPEYQFDVINFASIHDYKQITLNNGESSRCLTFQVENKGWDNNGADVQVEISFSVDYITKTNCCNDKIELSRCATCEKTISGMWATTSLQYTDPFNTMVLPNRYYMIYDTITGQSTLMYLTTKDIPWRIPDTQWNYVCFGAYKWYLDNSGHYRIYQYLESTLTGLVVNNVCQCLPNTWAQLYVSDNGGAYVVSGAPVYMSTAMSNGINHTVISGHNYKFKFYMFNNNCTYGYSNEVTVVVP